MSTAFAFPCSDNNHKVSIVGTHLEDNFIDIFKSNKFVHPVLKSKIPNNVKIYKFNNLDFRGVELKEFEKCNLKINLVNYKNTFEGEDRNSNNPLVF